jgi:hypothetical protein
MPRRNRPRAHTTAGQRRRQHAFRGGVVTDRGRVQTDAGGRPIVAGDAQPESDEQ